MQRIGSSAWVGFCLLMALTSSAWGTITMDGLVDPQVAVDSIRFRALHSDGFEQTALLDGNPVAIEDWVVVTDVGLHLLWVTRLDSRTGASEKAGFQFVILSSERGDSEFGLFPWTPRPPIDSAPEEFVGAHLMLVVPSEFPAGLARPVVAFVRDENARRLGLNGSVKLGGAGNPTLKVKRGVGFAFLPAATNSGAEQLQGSIEGLTSTREIHTEPQTVWQDAPNEITQETVWGENSRIHVRTNLSIRAGARLVVEAGTVVQLAPGVEIALEGTLTIRGAVERPVTFLPERRETPWGGVVLAQAPAKVEATGAIFTGSGAQWNYYITHPTGSVHRTEESLFHLGQGAVGVFQDCWIIDLAGQALHGEQASLTLDRCLVQRCVLVGQFNGGAVQITNSALLDFPNDDSQFVDGDNDAVYFISGSHRISDTLIGWTKDDGIDAGGDGNGDVEVKRCWIESCFHEGIALSGYNRVVTLSDSVVMNCGQAVEAGYYAPQVTVSSSLFVANEVGARFGDNYWQTHAGLLRVTNSYLLYNARNCWGFVRELWTQDLARMDIASNFLSSGDPLHTNNLTWLPDQDGPRLTPFRSPQAGKVGAGFLTRQSRFENRSARVSIPVGLSSFSDRTVTIGFALRPVSATPEVDFRPVAGTLTFPSGQTVATIPIEVLGDANRRFSVTVEVVLTDPVNAGWGQIQPTHILRLLATPTAEDTDADGLPDTWEAPVVAARSDDAFASIQDVEPDDDFDGDGMSNQNEYLSATSPTDSQSRLGLSAVVVEPGSLTLRFTAMPGIRYQVEAAGKLEPPIQWQVLAAFDPKPERTDQILPGILLSERTNRFYRVVVPKL